MDYVKEMIALLRDEGIEIEYDGQDLDLREYIADSVQFITFIVDIESKFEIEIPDDYLLYDSISSLHSFAQIVRSLRDDVEASS